ncbi:MAG TPA: hemolysin III family protein [Naasia sp.]|jgi:hemolysin III
MSTEEPRSARREQDLEHVRQALSDERDAGRADEEDAAGLPNIPLLEDELDHPVEARPTWRGWIHAGTFPLAILLGVVLISVAQGAVAKTASAVFLVTSLLLFGNSALYHRFDWRPPVKRLLKRIDHANIFLLIAGTYTPLSLLALPPDKGIPLLAGVWGGALVGIGFRVFWISAPRWLYVPIYVGLGWAAIVFAGDLFATNATMMSLVLAGGVLYTAGAVIYGIKRPNPFPGRFGFHEIFHTCTVLAFGCHWTATLLIALDPAFNR